MDGPQTESNFFNELDQDATPNTNRCEGDGLSGHRIHFFYVYQSGTPNRLAANPNWRGRFRNKIGYADAYLDNSDSTKDQHLRQLCESVGGVLKTKITELECPAAGGIMRSVVDCLKSNNFDGDENDDRTPDYDQGNGRIYSAFVDGWPVGATAGQGTVGGDDSSSTANRGAEYSYTLDWMGTTTLHELGHNLGAVQLSATHADGGNHCHEEYDLMCQAGAPGSEINGVVTEGTCGSGEGWKFDCGHNLDGHTHNGTVVGSEDYWDPNNPQRYLATHWNTANSLFLTAIVPD